MKSRGLIVLTLVLVAAAIVSGCDSLGGGGEPSGRPTPTLPFPTPIVIQTGAAAPTTAATAVPPPSAAAGDVAGEVFNDSNGNGAKDQGEPVIAGVIVILANGACPGSIQAQTTTTANQPSYTFIGLNPAEYCVSVDAASPQNSAILGPGQWTLPVQAQGTAAAPVAVEAGQTIANVDFGWTFAALSEATPVPSEPTAIVPPPLLPTPTAFVEPTAGPQPCVYRARYLADVTVPDGTVFNPGAQFVKTWRVQNTGTCPWGPGTGLQNLAFTGGDPMGSAELVPIPNAIAEGATGDLSIQMVAPAQPGSYTSNWKLRADDGTLIGVGPSSVALFVQITVRAAAQPTAVPPPPSPTSTAPTQVIQMAPGATEAEVQGQLAADGIASYSLTAQAGQNMALSLSSNSNTARVAVLSPSGVPLPPQRGNNEGTYWQGNLPTNGNYVIQVLAGNGAPTANFSLNVTIPVRIVFAPGAVTAQVSGTTSNGRIVTYLLRANGGQTMTVTLNAPANSAGITIYGLEDGQPLIRSQTGATTFTGQLPATQDYVIQVVPFGNSQVNYTLDVTVQ